MSAIIPEAREWYTPRQIEILELSARGLRTKEIADKLNMSAFTVRAHIRNVYRYGRAKTLTQAVCMIYGIS